MHKAQQGLLRFFELGIFLKMYFLITQVDFDQVDLDQFSGLGHQVLNYLNILHPNKGAS